MAESREQNKARLKKIRAERPQWNNEKNLAWKSKNPEKYKAHKKVEYALVSGKMVRQPCERCGMGELVHAHHDDYTKPLDVRWLCPLHHRERHRELLAENEATIQSA